MTSSFLLARERERERPKSLSSSSLLPSRAFLLSPQILLSFLPTCLPVRLYQVHVLPWAYGRLKNR